MNSSSYGNGASTFQPSKSNERPIYTVDGNKNTKSYNDDDEDEFCWFARTFCCCITNRNKTSS